MEKLEELGGMMDKVMKGGGKRIGKVKKKLDVKNRMVMMIEVNMKIEDIKKKMLGMVDMGVVGKMGKEELIGGIEIGEIVLDLMI